MNFQIAENKVQKSMSSRKKIPREWRGSRPVLLALSAIIAGSILLPTNDAFSAEPGQIATTDASHVLPNLEGRPAPNESPAASAELSEIKPARELSLNLATNTSDLAQPFQAPMSMTNSRLLHVTSKSSKADLVKKFRALADRQTDELDNIDDRIKKYLKESTDVTLSNQDLKGAERKFKVLNDSLTQLNQAHLERKERQDLYSRFALAIDSKWNGQPLKDFLSGQALDISELELTSEKGSAKAGIFLVYLSVALREVVERNEDVVNFVEDFTNYSSILSPKSPVEFIASRSYTSGSLSYTAKAITPAQVSDLVSKKLDAIEAKQAKVGDSNSTSQSKANSKTEAKKSKTAEGAQELRLKNFEPDFTKPPSKQDPAL